VVKNKNRFIKVVPAFFLGLVAANSYGVAGILSRLNQGESLTISAIGTSLTAGGAWLDPMGAWLNSKYPGKVTLDNEAISGSASPSGIDVQLPAALQHNPDAIFIEFAINDASTDLNIPLETSKANLQTMINAIRDWAAGKHKAVDIIIQTMNNEPWSGVRPNLPDYYEGYRQVAATNGLLLIDNYPNWLSLYNSQADHTTWKSYMDSIGVHPNPLGVGKIILPDIQQALKGQVPEPNSLLMLGAGVIALLWYARRKGR
jgi:acyl-CoA thioesterase I